MTAPFPALLAVHFRPVTASNLIATSHLRGNGAVAGLFAAEGFVL